MTTRESDLPPTKTFGERLQFLLDAVRHPSGRAYNLTEIAEGINARGGFQISRSYLSLLKDGKKPAPSKECMEAIAGYFGVPASYFTDDDTCRWVEEEIRLVSSMRNSPVRHISLQAYGLSEGSLRVLAEAIEHLRRLEKLPQAGEGPPTKRRRRWGKRDETGGVDPSQGPAAARS